MAPSKVKSIVVKTTESILVILFIIFEDLIWDTFARPVIRYFKKLALFDALKDTFLQMNRYVLLAIFIGIFTLTEVMGVVAGVNIFNGNVLRGVLVYALKIPIAAFSFWLFDLTRDILLQFNWLRVTYEYLMKWVKKLTTSELYIRVREVARSVRTSIRRLKNKYFEDAGFFASLRNHYIYFKSRINLK